MRVYIDFKAPAAYLALRATLACAKKYDIALEWKSYRTSQQAIPAQIAAEDKGQIHRRVRAVARQSTHLHYAAVQDLPMKFPVLPGSTDLALQVLEQLPTDCREAFVCTCFAAYWVTADDLNDPHVVSRLLQASNLDAAILDSIEPADLSESINLPAQEVDGVVDVPAYLIGDHVFVGREHLPWIEELLQSGAN